MEEFAKYTLSMNVNGNILTLRTNTIEEMKEEVPVLKEFILHLGSELRNGTTENLLKNPPPIPPELGKVKPEKCTSCGSTKLVYSTGISKGTGNPWHAFDCLECTQDRDGQKYPTRMFVKPQISQQKPPAPQKPTTSVRKEKEVTNCEECNKEMSFAEKKYSDTVGDGKNLCVGCRKKK
jgi:hypothetical protein